MGNVNLRIGTILFGESDLPVLAYKDVGMTLYELAKNYHWKANYYFFKTRQEEPDWSDSFLKFVTPICIAEESVYKKQVQLAKQYIQAHAKELDVLMLFNYGSTNWKLAKIAKKTNPHIIVYCKLDMGPGGFSHFINHRFGITLKNLFEKLKSTYVDWFTVETKAYYEALAKTSMFKNRIAYLPNGVSLLNVNTNWVEGHKKENIIMTSGRIGTQQKNNELLADAIPKIPKDILDTWKFYFVGPYTDAFYQYIESIKSKNPYLTDKIILTGNITDRDDLYSYYQRAKMICMTSRWESTCIATLEAMYFGAYPMLTRYSSFVDDTTNYEKCGIIVPSDADALAKVLTEKMQDPKLAAQGGSANSMPATHSITRCYPLNWISNFGHCCIKIIKGEMR